MIRYSTEVYTGDHLWEDIISSVAQGIRRLILRMGPPWLFVKARECQVVGTDKHKERYWRGKKQPGLCQKTLAACLCTTTGGNHCDPCVIYVYNIWIWFTNCNSIRWSTENTDVRKFQSSNCAESNTIMKYSLSQSACTYTADCKRRDFGSNCGRGWYLY